MGNGTTDNAVPRARGYDAVGEVSMKRLERWQAEKIHAAIRPHLAYLYRLRNRMDETGMHKTTLYRLVCETFDATHALYGELHSLACPSGNGRKADEQ